LDHLELGKLMSDSPLHLYQVLEQEFERIHGTPPPQMPPPAEGEALPSSEQKLRKVIGEIHKRQHTAICLSGGGIRSATFGLGVLQALAHNNLLDKFSYLSTVSGGGYVGGWLSAWIHRHPEGVAGVAAELPSEHPELLLTPEPEPVTHLRSYSNYLTPQLGLLSADSWTLAAIVCRNLILNWLVLIPLLLALLALPRLFVSVALITPPGVVRWSALVLSFLLGVWVIAYIGLYRPSIARKHNNTRHFLTLCLLPLFGSATLLTLYWAWINHAADLDGLEKGLKDRTQLVLAMLLFAIAMHVFGWLVYSFWLRRFPKLVTWKELLALCLNGAVGGLLLWGVATRVFPQPTAINFHAPVASGAASAEVKVQMSPASFCVTCSGGSTPANPAAIQIPTLLSYSAVAVPLYLILVLLALTLFAGISSRWTEDEDREWWARFGGWTLLALTAWALVSSLVLIGPGVLEWVWAKYIMGAGGIVGVLTALLASSSKAPAKHKDAHEGGIMSLVASYALPLGAIVFTVVLVVFLSLGTNYLLALLSSGLGWLIPRMNSWLGLTLGTGWVDNQTMDLQGNAALLRNTGLAGVADHLVFASTRQLLILIGATGGLGLGMAYLINTNKFSYHAMYRNRLIRAYLGASRHNSDRTPNPFTGFDPEDNLPMNELRPELLHSDSFLKFDQLIARLVAAQAKEEKEPHLPSRYLVSNILSDASQTLLGTYEVGGPSDQTRRLLLRSLTADLNKAILKKELIFPADIVTLPTQPKITPSGAALVDLNRRLLEGVYEEEILPYPKDPRPPLHVVNMTLNLVRGARLAWQQRKAESFTVSPLHCGSFQIPDVEDPTHPAYGSYRDSAEYGGLITLGTAVAISGAAVSPNMGYYSSPIVTFLMTLFNVRLGWWLGNPGPKGEDYYKLAYPKSAVYPIVAEALGLTDDQSRYIYLSDGGHFENLGVYEMVLRRCALIVVSDGSADPDFEFDGLGNAVQKVRADFGIPIDFEPMAIFSRKEMSDREQKKGAYCALGTIRYSEVDLVDLVDEEGKPMLDAAGKPLQGKAPDGIIIYVKPVFYGDEPRDIYHYAMTHKLFPHESTADQWFSESQFESYRKLGSYMIDTICKGLSETVNESSLSDASLSAFLRQAQERAKDPAAN
jgi:hypothetical protein